MVRDIGAGEKRLVEDVNADECVYAETVEHDEGVLCDVSRKGSTMVAIMQ